MPMGKEHKMIEMQKQMSAEKVLFAKDTVDAMIEAGEAVTPYTVWKKSKLSKSFIYNNKEIMDYIAAHRSEKKYNYRKYTADDVNAAYIVTLEKENEFLRRELNQMRHADLKELLDENQILRYRLAKYEELVKQGFLTNPKTEEK